MWLECTSQKTSAGYMGTFTGNRKALLVTDNGGVIVSTPMFKASEHKELRKATATIDEKGDLHITENAVLTGIKQDFAHDLLNEYTEVERMKILNKYFAIPTYSVNKYDYKETKGKIPVILETLDITAPAYASTSGKRMFIVPNLFNKQSKFDNDKPRMFDIIPIYTIIVLLIAL